MPTRRVLLRLIEIAPRCRLRRRRRSTPPRGFIVSESRPKEAISLSVFELRRTRHRETRSSFSSHTPTDFAARASETFYRSDW